MARSSDPRAYDTAWIKILEQMRKSTPQLRISSPTKKPQSLVMEFHCYRAAWKKEAQRLRLLKNFPLADEAQANYDAMIVYSARANKISNYVELTFAPANISVEIISDSDSSLIPDSFSNLSEGLASGKPFIYFSILDYLPDPGEIAGWKQTRLTNDQIRFDPQPNG